MACAGVDSHQSPLRAGQFNLSGAPDGALAVAAIAALAGGETRLDGLKPDESVEKKNMRMLIQLVYGSYGDNWTVESAGTTMKMDCESGR
ncbi:MAG: hypothetical protein EBR07_06375 [Planctomycetes bacterium]|nr:hypothetical protein [Planctomycetota bacterium]